MKYSEIIPADELAYLLWPLDNFYTLFKIVTFLWIFMENNYFNFQVLVDILCFIDFKNDKVFSSFLVRFVGLYRTPSVRRFILKSY